MASQANPRIQIQKQQAVVRGTTNPAPCCHLANAIDSGDNKQIVLRPDDPFTRIDPKFNQVVPYGHSTPSLKISCKSVQPFSRNVADKETNKETNKEIARKQYPVPLPGAG